MYVTTFYSFKGGVGRTMALANCGVELANRGRKVLLVDFDLEAPGLDAFEALRGDGKTPGIVEFVDEYLSTAQSPDVRQYTYRVPAIGKRGGELWVMPAGAQERNYGTRFREIDWNFLYSQRDGFVLFEDLKAQCDKTGGFDWMLVDSRTGHTDTGGICTRQLPDAVVLVFFPNLQNLRGLERVVREIRAEREHGANNIELHFVMSNVPDLDDEDRILEGHIREFRRRLEMPDDPMVVHRYDSLALLNQALFVRDRPRSRLAREYRAILKTIVRGNLRDRDSALDRIRERSELRPWARRRRLKSFDDEEGELKRIRDIHGEDAEVLFELGRLHERRRRPDEAAELFDLAISRGTTEPEALLFRGARRADGGDRNGAAQDGMAVLQQQPRDPWQLAQAIEIAASTTHETELLATPAVSQSPVASRLWSSAALAFKPSPRVRRVAQAMLDSLSEDQLETSSRARRRHSMGLLHLSAGRCDSAMRLLTRTYDGTHETDTADAFNYAMAAWGSTGTVDQAAFRRVLDLVSCEADPTAGTRRPQVRRSSRLRDPNFLQCLAIAHWAVGDRVNAGIHLRRARTALESSGVSSPVSCWRYTETSRAEFLEDLDEIEKLIAGDDSIRPRFFAASEAKDPASDETPVASAVAD